MDEPSEEEELTNQQLSVQILDKLEVFNNLMVTQSKLKRAIRRYISTERDNQKHRCNIISLEQQLMKYETSSVKREQFEQLQECYKRLQVEYDEQVNTLSRRYQEAHRTLQEMTAECDKLKRTCPSLENNLNTSCNNNNNKKKPQQRRQKRKTSEVIKSEDIEKLENKCKDVEQNFKEKQKECGTLRDELDLLTENYKAEKSKMEDQLSSLKQKLKYVETTKKDLQDDKEKMCTEMQTLQEKVKRLRNILPADIDEDNPSSMPVIDRQSKKQTKNVSLQTNLETSLKNCDDLQNQIDLLKNTHRCERIRLEKKLSVKEREIENMRLLEMEHLQEVQSLTLENKVLKEQTNSPFRDLESQNELNRSFQGDVCSVASMTSDDDGRLLENNLRLNVEDEPLNQSFDQNTCNEIAQLQNELSNKDDEISRHAQTIKILKSTHHEEIEVLKNKHCQEIEAVKGMYHEETEALKSMYHQKTKEIEFLKTTHHKEITDLKDIHQHEIEEIRGEMQVKATNENDRLIDLLPDNFINTLVTEMTVPRLITPLSLNGEEIISVSEIMAEQEPVHEEKHCWEARILKEVEKLIDKKLNEQRKRILCRRKKLRRFSNMCLRTKKNKRRKLESRRSLIPIEVSSELQFVSTLNPTESYDSLYEKPQGSVDSGCAISNKCLSSSEDEDEMADKDKEITEVIAGSKDDNVIQCNNMNKKRKIAKDRNNKNPELSLSKLKKAKLGEEIIKSSQITEGDENIEEIRTLQILHHNETIEDQDPTSELSGSVEKIFEIEENRIVSTDTIDDHQDQRSGWLGRKSSELIENVKARLVTSKLTRAKSRKSIEAKKTKRVRKIIKSNERQPSETIDQNQTSGLSETNSSETKSTEAEKTAKVDEKTTESDNNRTGGSPNLISRLRKRNSYRSIETKKADHVRKISESKENIEEIRIRGIPQPSETIANEGSKLPATKSPELVQTERPQFERHITTRSMSTEETSADDKNKDPKLAPTGSTSTEAQNKKVTKNIKKAMNKRSIESTLRKAKIRWKNNSIPISRPQKLHKETEILIDEPPAKRTRRAFSSNTNVVETEVVTCKTVDDSSKDKKITKDTSEVTQTPQQAANNETVKIGKLSDEQIALRKKSAQLLLKPKTVNVNCKDLSRSFKRPNKSKPVIVRENAKTETCDNSSTNNIVENSPELFESPLSPVPEPIPVHEFTPKIIPLEKTPEVIDDLSEPGLILSDEEDQGESISQTKEATLDEMMERKLLYLLQFSNSRGAAEDVARYFSDKPTQQTVRAIMKVLRRDQCNKAKITNSKGGPLVTMIQELLLDLMMKLEQRGIKDIMDCFLDAVERSMFWLHNIDQLEPYARVHVAVCLQKYYYTRMRYVLSKALTIMQDEIVLPYVYIVIRSWPRLIPQNDDTKLGPYDMLEVRALLQAIKLKTANREFSKLCQTNLMLLLTSDFYGFKNGLEDSTALLRDLFAAYLKGISEGITYFTIAICKGTHKNIVFNLIDELKPQLVKANDLHEICPVIRLIGVITSLFSENKAAANRVNSNKEFLKQYCTDLYPKSVQELAVEIMNNLTND
ncbi:hypothetical protein ILUMI_02168 [Ignelater luminosus]|uniref:Uncharacterized protein n=1 Tax=Ignelater luminosus TaxID=2038154 RepID=A0A8K0DIR1_IGNLU|nr:hypothetical protein ILUMI_02168 [Ignelater luminosus]